MVIGLALLVFTLLSSHTVHGAASTYPAPISLFHKSPYLNAWIDTSSNLSTSPPSRWPFFFNRFKNVGWYMAVRIDGTSYTIQGNRNNANYTGVGVTLSTSITPTQTRFTVAAGPVSVNLTYLTPIELQDWRLHSFPFAYAVFDVASSDGSPHEVQVYTDTSIQFVSSDDSNFVSWNTSLTTKSIIHMAQQRTMRSLVETNDMSEDGSQVFAYTQSPNVSMTWQTTFRETARLNFNMNGRLDNTSDTDFRTIAQYPVLAYALDLGNVTQNSNPLVFAIGLVRDPVVSYRTAETTQHLSHLWQSKWSSIGSAVDDFLTSYPSALSRASAFDNLIQVNATALASQLRMTTAAATKFVDLHILNLRQTVGSLEFTTSKRGQPLALSDVRVFMKDIGYSRRINPVEILYASFPAFLFINTTLAGKLLEPLFEFQATPSYGNSYAAPDLGNSWPDIQGNTTNQSSLAIDSCGAMLIMSLAQARKSGDGALIFKYYNLLRKWADFLVQSTKQPGNYMSSDSLSGSNANLELKGIMGLYAMGKINSILESRGADASKTSYYLDTANTRVQDWLNRAVTSDHIVSSYGANSTWSMIYNLYAPRLLGASIIPEQIYETQALWYANRSGTATRFGLQFDSTQSLAKAHWTLLSASSVFNATSSAGRDALIGMVHSRTSWQSGVIPNPATYSPIDGNVTRGPASPAMGAIYSLLALSLPDLGINLPSGTVPSVPSSPSASKAPVIVGAIFGTLAGLLLIAAVIYLLRRYRILESERVIAPPEEVQPTPFNEFRPLTMSEQNNVPIGNTPTKMSRTPRSEKLSAFLLRGSNSNRTGSATDSSVTGGSSMVASEDNNLRHEVEQLRRVVETLSAQQVNPYQDSTPDEPPPMYPSNH